MIAIHANANDPVKVAVHNQEIINGKQAKRTTI